LCSKFQCKKVRCLCEKSHHFLSESDLGLMLSFSTLLRNFHYLQTLFTLKIMRCLQQNSKPYAIKNWPITIECGKNNWLWLVNFLRLRVCCSIVNIALNQPFKIKIRKAIKRFKRDSTNRIKKRKIALYCDWPIRLLLTICFYHKTIEEKGMNCIICI